MCLLFPKFLICNIKEFGKNLLCTKMGFKEPKRHINIVIICNDLKNTLIACIIT
jgi:hypothetical protein